MGSFLVTLCQTEDHEAALPSDLRYGTRKKHSTLWGKKLHRWGGGRVTHNANELVLPTKFTTAKTDSTLASFSHSSLLQPLQAWDLMATSSCIFLSLCSTKT